jgi:hypothetical protein
MQNGVVHEAYFFWNDPYVYPSYFGVVEGTSNYHPITRKVNIPDYIIAPSNPEREE